LTPPCRSTGSAWSAWGAMVRLQGLFGAGGSRACGTHRAVRPPSPVTATTERKKRRNCKSFSDPSRGLEPSTPSLPSIFGPLPSVARGCRSAYFAVLDLTRFATGCHRLRPLGSINAPSLRVNREWTENPISRHLPSELTAFTRRGRRPSLAGAMARRDDEPCGTRYRVCAANGTQARRCSRQASRLTRNDVLLGALAR